MSEPASEPSTQPELEIHPDTCVGTGMCTFYAPHTFDLGDDGHVRLFAPGEADGEDTDEELANAAEACPTRSIRLGASVE